MMFAQHSPIFRLLQEEIAHLHASGDSLQLLIHKHLILNKRRIQVIHDILRVLTALGHQVMLEWQLAALSNAQAHAEWVV